SSSSVNGVAARSRHASSLSWQKSRLPSVTWRKKKRAARYDDFHVVTGTEAPSEVRSAGPQSTYTPCDMKTRTGLNLSNATREASAAINAVYAYSRTTRSSVSMS